MHKSLILYLLLCSSFLGAQSWTPVANLPSGRHHPVGWGLNGKGYVVTGSNSFDQPTDDFYEYDPVADTWTTKTSFPGPARSFAIGTTYNGIGYIGFGATNFSYLKDFWMYDPSTDTWTILASCPCNGRRHPAMMANNGKIYVGLGDGAAGNLKDWWVYDIATNGWQQLPDLPGLPRHHPFQFAVKGEVYAGMGHGGPTIFKDWYKYNQSTNQWDNMNFFAGEARVAGTQFHHGNYGYVLSGDGDNHSYMNTGEFWQYEPDTDTWVQMPPHPGISLWAPGSFVVNNEVYFFGGQNRQTSGFPTNAYKFPLPTAGVGLDENGVQEYQLFPNPATDRISWSDASEVDEVELINTVGQVVFRTNVTDSSMDLPEIESGIYLVNFYNGGNRLHTERLMIK